MATAKSKSTRLGAMTKGLADIQTAVKNNATSLKDNVVNGASNLAVATGNGILNISWNGVKYLGNKGIDLVKLANNKIESNPTAKQVKDLTTGTLSLAAKGLVLAGVSLIMTVELFDTVVRGIFGLESVLIVDLRVLMAVVEQTQSQQKDHFLFSMKQRVSMLV